MQAVAEAAITTTLAAQEALAVVVAAVQIMVRQELLTQEVVAEVKWTSKVPQEVLVLWSFVIRTLPLPLQVQQVHPQ
jgi:hypothetical protein